MDFELDRNPGHWGQPPRVASACREGWGGSSSPQDHGHFNNCNNHKWEGGIPKLTEPKFKKSREGLPELRAVTIRVMVHYSKRIEIKIGQGKRCIGQSPGELKAQGLQLSSPSAAGDSATFPSNDVWRYPQSCQPAQASGPRVFLRAFSRRHGWTPTWLISISSPSRGPADTSWPKSPT